MTKRLLVIAVLGVMMSGCVVVPLAFVGPAASGFSTTSLISSGIQIAVKQSTGKSIGEHALDAMSGDITKHTYFPTKKSNTLVEPQSNRIK